MKKYTMCIASYYIYKHDGYDIHNPTTKIPHISLLFSNLKSGSIQRPPTYPTGSREL